MFLPPKALEAVIYRLPLCLGCVAAHIQGIRVSHVGLVVLM